MTFVLLAKAVLPHGFSIRLRLQMYTPAMLGVYRLKKHCRRRFAASARRDGLTTPLTHVHEFICRVSFDNGLTEHEYDHVFTSVYDGEPTLNPDEADDWKWIDLTVLQDNITAYPERYTPWFIQLLPSVLQVRGTRHLPELAATVETASYASLPEARPSVGTASSSSCTSCRYSLARMICSASDNSRITFSISFVAVND